MLKMCYAKYLNLYLIKVHIRKSLKLHLFHQIFQQFWYIRHFKRSTSFSSRFTWQYRWILGSSRLPNNTGDLQCWFNVYLQRRMFRRQRITGWEGRKGRRERRKARDKTIQQYCFFPRNILVVLKPASQRREASALTVSLLIAQIVFLEPKGLQYWRDAIAMILSRTMREIGNGELEEFVSAKRVSK